MNFETLIVSRKFVRQCYLRKSNVLRLSLFSFHFVTYASWLGSKKAKRLTWENISTNKIILWRPCFFFFYLDAFLCSRIFFNFSSIYLSIYLSISDHKCLDSFCIYYCFQSLHFKFRKITESLKKTYENIEVMVHES